MQLVDHVRPDLVATDLRGRSVDEVLAELVALPAAAGLVRDPEGLAAALLRRERVHSTALGQGVAVPHGLCGDLEDPVVIVGLSGPGVPFGEGEEPEPVRIVFLLLSPPARSRSHIKLLARIARLARQDAFLAALRACSTGEDVVEAIRAFEREHV